MAKKNKAKGTNKRAKKLHRVIATKVPKKRLVVDPDEAASYVDYRLLFTNPVMHSFFGGLSQEYAKSSKSQRSAIANGTKLLVTTYAFLVYYLYPKKPKFKQMIKSNKELSSNFANVKAWLDKNDAKKAADYFVATMHTKVAAALMRER